MPCYHPPRPPYISPRHYFTRTPMFLDKCIILPSDAYFWSNALFYPHTYISFANCIILPPDAYFWLTPDTYFSSNALFYPQTAISFAKALFHTQTYISLAKCIIFPPQLYIFRLSIIVRFVRPPSQSNKIFAMDCKNTAYFEAVRLWILFW